MLEDSKFILRVQEHRILYDNSVSKINKADESKEGQLWNDIAQEFKLKDASAAFVKWRELTQNYIKYLMHGDANAFPYFNEMIFMQPYIMSRLGSPAHSDFNMDETELQSILDSDNESECDSRPISPKRQRLRERPADENCDQKNSIIPSMAKSLQCEISKEHCDVPPAHIEGFSNSSSFTNLSSLELIFLGYAKALLKMPLALQVQTKRKIAEIMDEAEMSMLE